MERRKQFRFTRAANGFDWDVNLQLENAFAGGADAERFFAIDPDLLTVLQLNLRSHRQSECLFPSRNLIIVQRAFQAMICPRLG